MVLKLVFALLLAYSAHALKCYRGNFTVFSKDAELQPLDSDGLSGRYTGLRSDYTRGKEISFQVWFLSSDEAAQWFFLSVVAIRKSIQAQELYNPIILWSANRNQQNFVGENATLTFGTDGNLKLKDSGNLVWSTDTANMGIRSLCISDWGSILLLNSSENIVWDSSDQPSDTIPFRKAFKTGSRLVSWTSTQNSTEGPYSLVMESNRLALYFHSDPYWAFDFYRKLEPQASVYSVFCWQRNGLVTIDLRTNFSQVQENGLVAPESCENGSPEDQRVPLAVNGTNLNFHFIKLQPDGDLVLYTWNSQNDYWYAAYNLSSIAKCFLPRSCGLYGLCDKRTGKCQDSCPPTFQMIGTDCKPPAKLDSGACGQRVRFIQQNQTDYFCSNYSGATFLCESQEDCENSCKFNCSCKAAFYRNNTCIQTFNDVQSLQTGDYAAFLKVADEQRSSSHHHKNYKIAIIVLTVVILLLLGCLWKCRRPDRGHLKECEQDIIESKVMKSMLKRFTYQDLETITSNFSHRLGTGGYGSVFKGQLLDGTDVAVKRLEGSQTSSKDFCAELDILARTHHVNLVKLLGVCAQGPSRRLLIYEYMAKGSLEKWIFQEDNKPESLETRIRHKIAIGTARGLSYLHEECAQKIIHVDLKPGNVLLDDAFEPKIADFGLSKLMNRDASYLQMTTMRGTPGYLAPECLQEGTLTEKSDVFSFGILLLEIATGCQHKNISDDYLHAVTSNNLNHNDHLPEETAKNKLTSIAFLCIQDDPNSRPVMSKVVQMLEGLIEIPAPPPESDLRFFLAYRSRMKPHSSTRLNSSSMKRFAATSSLKSEASYASCTSLEISPR